MNLKILCLITTLALTGIISAQMTDKSPAKNAPATVKQTGRQNPAFGDVEWKLKRLGASRFTATDYRRPFLSLNLAEGRVQGSGPCNRFSATMETDGKETLHFGALMATKMACGGLAAESAFFTALENTVRFTVKGKTLTFFDTQGNVVLVFKR
jgi:heat shock protein HslJ